MPIEITMPKLSDTMEEGTILHWYKHEGERVQEGDVIAEVETDKADMELEADKTGVIAEIRVKEGEPASVGAVIALLKETAEAAETAPAAPAAAPPATTSRAAAVAAEAAPSGRTTESTTPRGPARPAAPAPSPTPPKPLPARVTATGAARLAPVPRAAERQPESKLRQTVAKQMSASKREIPHFYVTAEIDMSEAARMRAGLALDGAQSERITFTHLLIRALALTLVRHPRMNASWSDEGIVFHNDVNIGIAVALEGGLLAPVLRGCQSLSLRAIARATSELVSKAQAGRFGGDELSGATFTLSNLGVVDIEEFSAVITPPQAAILAVGTIKDRPVVRDGHLAVAKTMRVTLSVDHRVMNGMEAGRFLEDLKRVLENPVLLVVATEAGE